MYQNKEENFDKTLLVFNSHEAWVYQLGVLGFNLDIITGLKGRYIQGWDYNIRPAPSNSRFISLPEAQRCQTQYHCIITHNITDLLDMKFRSEPKIMVIHLTLESRIAEDKANIDPEAIKQMLHKYVELTGTHVVAVTEFKGRSWGFSDDVVPFYTDPDDYLPYSGEQARGLRIANFIQKREQYLFWDFHQKAFDGLPVTIIGYNPQMPGALPSQSWNDLKKILQSHRFFIHTADPHLEDGFNMATFEAMAAALPVLGNRHPTSIIEHGVNGFLSDKPAQLRKYAEQLLENRKLAAQMGLAAQRTITERFSKENFKAAFLRSIEAARKKNQNLKSNFTQISDSKV